MRSIDHKDETVYVIAGADGSVRKVIVSDWIKNTLGSSTINDKIELTNVENIKSDNTCVWDAHGDDMDGQAKFIYRTDAVGP